MWINASVQYSTPVTSDASSFRVGLTHDLRGAVGLGIDMSSFETCGTAWEFLPEGTEELSAEAVSDFDALVVFAPRVTAATLRDPNRLVLLVRIGSGVDTVDVEACTAHGVMVATTPDGVRRPVATAAVAMLLALAYRLLPKHIAAQEAGWPRRFTTVGVGLTGKTVGLVGYGNVGREIARLLEPFGLHRLAYSPTLTRARAAADGVEATSIDNLLLQSDVLILACPLKPETQHLLSAERIAALKPGALVVNVARGGVIDQTALAHALTSGQLAGAALDVFEVEPVPTSDPILAAPNVLLAPHGAAYVDELFRGCFASASAAVRAVADGRAPEHLVNAGALKRLALSGRLAGA